METGIEETMNELSNTTQTSKNFTGSGCLSELVWFLSGFVLPLGSFTFYRKAVKKSVGEVVLFFLTYTLAISFFASLGIGYTLLPLANDIHASFEDGTVPQIVIRDGVAEVDGPQPIILFDTSYTATDRTLLAIDTTGQITQIDRGSYDQGFLLKKKELHMLNNNGRYQVLPLYELNSAFETDPIIINAETASKGWQVFSIIAAFASFIGLAIWNSVIRLMFISMIALVLWGGISLFRPKTGFGPVIISGIYALVPALYIHRLFDRSGLSIFGLQTVLLVTFWLIALFISLSQENFLLRERPLRLWRTLLGLPLIIVMAVDIVLTFNYGDIVSWAVMLLTVIALVIVGIPPLVREKQTSPPEPPAPSAE